MMMMYRVNFDEVMDYSKNWKAYRKNNLKEYKDDNNSYCVYSYASSFENAVKMIEDAVKAIGIENPETEIYKWKNKKNGSDHWTVTINTKRIKPTSRGKKDKEQTEDDYEIRKAKAVITEFEMC